MSASINDDYLATLFGQFTDPGSDSQTVTIDWGDGSPPQQLSLSNAEREFSATHPYPVPEGSTNYVISVTVTDQDGGSDSEAISLVVAEPSAVLRGQKFEDLDGDAVRDADEPALAGWTIELVDAASGEALQTTVTDGEGAYEFSEVPRGDYLCAQSPTARLATDIAGDPVRRVSVDASGGESDGQSDAPSVSGHGRFVAFSSLASDLVPEDTNGFRDIFVKDTMTGEIERVSFLSTAARRTGPATRRRSVVTAI